MGFGFRGGQRGGLNMSHFRPSAQIVKEHEEVCEHLKVDSGGGREMFNMSQRTSLRKLAGARRNVSPVMKPSSGALIGECMLEAACLSDREAEMGGDYDSQGKSDVGEVSTSGQRIESRALRTRYGCDYVMYLPSVRIRFVVHVSCEMWSVKIFLSFYVLYVLAFFVFLKFSFRC
eukprot:Selendium_serpulae@DN10429_c0_g1_i1.p1